KRLRLRLLDTWREDHAHPRIFEIEVWRASDEGLAAEPAETPLSSEKRSERLLLERALGRVRALPGTPFDPARGWLGHARDFLEVMIDEGTDRYGEVRSPLFAS